MEKNLHVRVTDTVQSHRPDPDRHALNAESRSESGQNFADPTRSGSGSGSTTPEKTQNYSVTCTVFFLVPVKVPYLL